MKIPTFRRLLCLGTGALLLAPSCSNSSSGDGVVQRNLAQTLESEGLTSLRAALEDAGLLPALTSGTLTLFAPSNAAFEQLPDGLLGGLTSEQLSDLLLYHLIDTGAVSSAAASSASSAAMANGDEVILDVVGGALHVNEGRVVKADVQATNGVLHVIDRVLLPPTDIRTALELRGLTVMLSILEDLDGGGGALRGDGFETLTLLAPTDEAFATLPKGFLEGLDLAGLFEFASYHALEGPVVASEALTAELAPSLDGQALLFELGAGGATVNGARIGPFNIPVEGGVLHVIDTALLRPGTLTGTASDLKGFSTLVAALQAAGLAPAFDDPGAGPFTVFAPTDAAFADLPPGLLDDLVNEPGTPTLIRILEYHVVQGTLTANAVAASAGDGIVTLEGGTLTVSVEGDAVTIDGATVLVPNVLCSNGMIHAIDAVLLPDGIVLP